MEDADAYSEYVESFLATMKEEALAAEGAELSLSLSAAGATAGGAAALSPLRRQQKEQEKLLEQSAGLAGLLLEILPGVDDAALQALAFEAASLYLAN